MNDDNLGAQEGLGCLFASVAFLVVMASLVILRNGDQIVAAIIGGAP